MKKLFILTVLITALISCKNGSDQKAEAGEEFESFVVKETLAAGGYTYILGEQNDTSKWFAITAREVIEGEKYYYAEPLVMTDFYSKELDRPFDEVIFLMKVSKNPADLIQEADMKQEGMEQSASPKPSGKITTDKLDLSIEIPENGTSIAQLYENMKLYSGKKLIVKGQVVKFSPEIMNTNWVHLQDGTAFNEKYDLTVTTGETVAVGDIVTFEGTVTIDKDFGYGYFYEVLLEGAVIVK